MIEVRIRHHTEAKPVHLCTWPVTDLDSLIPTLGAWGVTHIGTGEDVNTGGLSGEFKVDDTCAYFEVVIGGDE